MLLVLCQIPSETLDWFTVHIPQLLGASLLLAHTSNLQRTTLIYQSHFTQAHSGIRSAGCYVPHPLQEGLEPVTDQCRGIKMQGYKNPAPLPQGGINSLCNLCSRAAFGSSWGWNLTLNCCLACLLLLPYSVSLTSFSWKHVLNKLLAKKSLTRQFPSSTQTLCGQTLIREKKKKNLLISHRM